MTELTGLDAKGVFRQVRLHQMTAAQWKRIIGSKMFFKEKFLSSGEFDKLKARYVASGHMQHKDEYGKDDTSSPTVSLKSVYLVANIAARERRKVSTMDVGTAYLSAVMQKDVRMRVQPSLAKILASIDPQSMFLSQMVASTSSSSALSMAELNLRSCGMMKLVVP